MIGFPFGVPLKPTKTHAHPEKTPPKRGPPRAFLAFPPGAPVEPLNPSGKQDQEPIQTKTKTERAAMRAPGLQGRPHSKKRRGDQTDHPKQQSPAPGRGGDSAGPGHAARPGLRDLSSGSLWRQTRPKSVGNGVGSSFFGCALFFSFLFFFFGGGFNMKTMLLFSAWGWVALKDTRRAITCCWLFFLPPPPQKKKK